MSLTSFRLSETQDIFYYDSETHSFYDSNKTLLSLPPEHEAEWYQEEAKKHGVTHKSNKPRILRVLLGQACNYSCGYCMQKDIGNLHERPKSFLLDVFLETVDAKLDLEQIERIELWGGEPFLYWNDMVPLMRHFDREGISFFISTNGSPLVQKHVDFFKTLKAKVEMAISHDGPGQEIVRGKDVLKNPNKVAIIKQLYDLYPKVSFSFNTVLSADNYDLFAINDYFLKFATENDMPNIRLMPIPIRNYDDTNSQNSANHVIQGEDLAKFNVIVKNYIDAYIDDFREGKIGTRLLRSGMLEGSGGVFFFAKKLKQQCPITVRSDCGADSEEILSIDMSGNVKLCPHTDDKYNAGTLKELEKARIKDLDLDRKNTHCYHCPVKRLCKSSCPIKLPGQVFLMNCAIEKIWYGNIQKGAFKLIFNQEVEQLEVGITD